VPIVTVAAGTCALLDTQLHQTIPKGRRQVLRASIAVGDDAHRGPQGPGVER
jgi:hypothetical protein